jgi:hypothetical protein
LAQRSGFACVAISCRHAPELLEHGGEDAGISNVHRSGVRQS